MARCEKKNSYSWFESMDCAGRAIKELYQPSSHQLPLTSMPLWPWVSVLQLRGSDRGVAVLSQWEKTSWAKIKLENYCVGASLQSLLKWPLTLSDSFQIRWPYCCKQLSVLSICSDSGSEVSSQSEFSDLIPPSWLTEQYPIRALFSLSFSVLSCLWSCFVWLEIRAFWPCSRYDRDVTLPRHPYGLPSCVN